jgi:hypothetical protein
VHFRRSAFDNTHDLLFDASELFAEHIIFINNSLFKLAPDMYTFVVFSKSVYSVRAATN